MAKWTVKDDVQKSLLSLLSDEFAIAKRNNEKVDEDFQVYHDMIHAVRAKKPNEWESDIYMPEFISRLLTQIGNFVHQYFGSSDFVDVSMDSDDPKDILEAKAGKKLLNTILNDKDSYYYQKITRLLMSVFPGGYGIIKGDYEQEIEEVISHYNTKSEFATSPDGMYLAEDGQEYLDPTLQRPLFDTIEEPVFKNRVITDRPTFDVYPVQSVYMSPEYKYSLNDKEYIIFETEMTISELKSSRVEYFNLDLLEKDDPEGKRGKTTYNREEDKEETKPVEKVYAVLERWGKEMVIEKDGEYLPGIGKTGKVLENATPQECIITYAKERGGTNLTHIIRFQKSPHTKRPMARFLCYVDMVNDNGFGDGEVNRELQTAVNDNYNLMNYRTKLSITPAFKGKRFSGVPEKIRISPENVTMVENMDDLQEWKIEDNIQGGIIHQNLLASRMDYSMATSPQSMGAMPERAETATMASIVSQRANVRMGMKSMNLEFIGFSEFYDMLLTLCNDFMLPETLTELVGDELAMAYNPKRKDKFKPVSQALDTEESKQFKVKTYQMLMGMIASTQNPKTPMVLNYFIGQILETLGGEFKQFKRFMFSEDMEANLLYQIATGSKGTGSPPGDNPMAPQQNQQGLQQGQAEQQVRGM